MSIKIYKKFTFEAAHRLPRVPDGHKCGRLHGHSFHLCLMFEGEIDRKEGWVTDFADIERVFLPIQEALDHRYLNEVPGLANPTSERIAEWIWQHLKPHCPHLCEIEVQETCTSGCVYRG
ncbi:MAG: 6-carboxytetrahydropterin synthase QueD [Gammaproteobacteria bacterium]|nr:6-carboxytetrahydropterin synthase QueD [Gammaproteobacteria bacterium]